MTASSEVPTKKQSRGYSAMKYKRYQTLNSKIELYTHLLQVHVSTRNALHNELKDTPEFIAMQRLETAIQTPNNTTEIAA